MPNNMTPLKPPMFIMFALISILLFIGINKWMHLLLTKEYVVECLTNPDQAETHTVNLPINTTYSCKNMCGPQARCSITGQQCTADIDCPGCQPKISGIKTQNSSKSVPGNDDAGKLTVGVTPQYSPLTSDIGTKALTILGKEFSKTPSPTFGINTWRDDFDAEQKLFDKRYKPPSDLEFMPSYPPRYSATGDFIENGPLASNATLN